LAILEEIFPSVFSPYATTLKNVSLLRKLGVRNDLLRSTQEENIRDALFTAALELVDRI
jgi:hypothetical protein